MIKVDGTRNSENLRNLPAFFKICLCSAKEKNSQFGGELSLKVPMQPF